MNHLAKTVLVRLPYSQWLHDFTVPYAPIELVKETPLRTAIE